jgi:large subunit ribosomal protein L23
MFTIIKRPVFTEKATRLFDLNKQYVFDVDLSLTKPQIRFLIEKRFSVQVSVVNTHRIPGKKRRGRVSGRSRPSFKRVIVTLGKGEKIEFFFSLFFL